MTSNDLEPLKEKFLMTLNPQKEKFLVNFSRFRAAMHILRVNCIKIAGNRPGQPAYKIFSTERTFLTI